MSCQHDPLLQTCQRMGEPPTQRVKCAKCGTATEWCVPPRSTADPNHPWQAWAGIMAKESEATATSLDARAREEAVCADRWRAFCLGYVIDPGLGNIDAKVLGVQLREEHQTVHALRRVMRGSITEKRIYDTFSAFRKAAQAYLANGQEPPR